MSEKVDNEFMIKNVKEVREAIVKPFGKNGAHVTVPKDWVGCYVQIVLLKD